MIFGVTLHNCDELMALLPPELSRMVQSNTDDNQKTIEAFNRHEFKYLVNKDTTSMINKPYNIVLYTLIPSIVTNDNELFQNIGLMFRGSVHKVYDWYGPIEQTQVLME